MSQRYRRINRTERMWVAGIDPAVSDFDAQTKEFFFYVLDRICLEADSIRSTNSYTIRESAVAQYFPESVGLTIDRTCEIAGLCAFNLSSVRFCRETRVDRAIVSYVSFPLCTGWEKASDGFVCYLAEHAIDRAAIDLLRITFSKAMGRHLDNEKTDIIADHQV